MKLYDILELKTPLKSVHSLAHYPIGSVPPSKFHDNVSITLHITSKFFPIHNLSVIPQTRCSSGSMVTMLRAGRSGFGDPVWQEICLFSKTSRPVLRPTQARIQWVPAFFPGVKAARTWSWLNSSSFDVKNRTSYIYSPLAWRQGTDRDSFTCIFTHHLFWHTYRVL